MSKIADFLLLVMFALVLVGGVLHYRGDASRTLNTAAITEPASGVLQQFAEVSTIETVLGEIDLPLPPIRELIVTPPPLRVEGNGQASVRLTTDGALQETNRHRAVEGLPPLGLNDQLIAAASAKIDDMFAHQYFEHTTPSGEGPASFVISADYAYLAVGENLALGNFATDRELVQAWIDSPGHRANIMSQTFAEIGIAAKPGIFEGKQTWLAVQMFALPASACNEPDSSERSRLSAIQSKVDIAKGRVDTLQQKLTEWKDAEEFEQYNEHVPQFNELVNTYNALLEQLKTATQIFNDQVRLFNSCLKAHGVQD